MKKDILQRLAISMIVIDSTTLVKAKRITKENIFYHLRQPWSSRQVSKESHEAGNMSSNPSTGY